MDLKKYFTFNGRMNRAKYILIPIISQTCLAVIQLTAHNTGDIILNILSPLLGIAYFAYTICMVVQRLHDIERPGIHGLFFFVPFYNLYFIPLLFIKKGTDGPNQYGEDPLADV